MIIIIQLENNGNDNGHLYCGKCWRSARLSVHCFHHLHCHSQQLHRILRIKITTLLHNKYGNSNKKIRPIILFWLLFLLRLFHFTHSHIVIFMAAKQCRLEFGDKSCCQITKSGNIHSFDEFDTSLNGITHVFEQRT